MPFSPSNPSSARAGRCGPPPPLSRLAPDSLLIRLFSSVCRTLCLSQRFHGSFPAVLSRTALRADFLFDAGFPGRCDFRRTQAGNVGRVADDRSDPGRYLAREAGIGSRSVGGRGADGLPSPGVCCRRRFREPSGLARVIAPVRTLAPDPGLRHPLRFRLQSAHPLCGPARLWRHGPGDTGELGLHRLCPALVAHVCRPWFPDGDLGQPGGRALAASTPFMFWNRFGINRTGVPSACDSAPPCSFAAQSLWLAWASRSGVCRQLVCPRLRNDAGE